MRYTVKSVRDEQFVSLSLTAGSETEAVALASAQGFEVVSVKRAFELPMPWRLGGLGSRFPLLQWLQQLTTLLDAGLNVLEAIDTLARREAQPAAKGAMDVIAEGLRRGERLSAGLERRPDVFPAMLIASVRAAEQNGTLREALVRYAEYRRQIELMRSRVISAAIYPCLVLLVGAAVVLFLLGFVVPRFSRIYESVSAPLPWLTIVLMEFGRSVDQYFTVWAGAFVVLLVAAIVLLSREQTRERLLTAVLRWKPIGRSVKEMTLAAFYRTLGMLARAGVPIVAALKLAREVLAPGDRGNADAAAEFVRQGGALSAALEKYDLSSDVAQRMLAVAERSGQLSAMFEKVAQFHEEELARSVEWFSRLFEPLLMAAVGIVIGTIVVLMYVPIFELAGAIQ